MRQARRRLNNAGAAAVAASFAFAVLVAPVQAQEDSVTVFAAASLQTAIDGIAVAWEAETGGALVVSYAATSALARQIEQGAPADVFLSADITWMDYLAERGLIRPETRIDLLANRLVLVAPASALEPVAIVPGLDLGEMLGDGRLALADTDAVPAGRYARAALQFLGLWDDVAGRLAPADNVRAALAFVSRRETPLGIVYLTDAAADPDVDAIGLFPETSHPPIVYPAAVVAGCDKESAAAFVEWLTSPAARCLFAAEGFVPLAADGTPAATVECGGGG